MTYELQNGDQVEIITAKRGGPSRDWLRPDLGYTRSARSRQKIRRWFRQQDREENITFGREQLRRELKRLNLLDRVKFPEIAELFEYKDVEDLFAAIGFGDLNSQRVAARVLQVMRREEVFVEEEEHQVAVTPEGIRVKGIGDLYTQLAQCCKPNPDASDPIIGYVTRGRGVTIHKWDCPNILLRTNRGEVERLIEVDWGSRQRARLPGHHQGPRLGPRRPFAGHCHRHCRRWGQHARSDLDPAPKNQPRDPHGHPGGHLGRPARQHSGQNRPSQKRGRSDAPGQLAPGTGSSKFCEEERTMNRKWMLIGGLLLALVAAVVALPGIQLAGEATERLTNGDFEEGFYAMPGGFVGNGWDWFHNSGRVEYGFYDETWAPVVAKGKHAQMIEVNTFDQGGSDPDRYAGIYQKVAVVPGETYELSMQGMLRALEDDPDRSGYNYRVQYAVDLDGGLDWTAVENWVELPWDTVHPRLSPGAMDAYSTSVEATGDYLTLFIRVWKKWGTTGRELDVNLDAVSLKGAMPPGDGDGPGVVAALPAYPVAGWRVAVPVAGSSLIGITKLELYDDGELVGSIEHEVGTLHLAHDFAWTPKTPGVHTLEWMAYESTGQRAKDQANVKVGEEGQFLVNGDFEAGFEPIPLGHVGQGWGWFYNNAQAEYGFYDETWTPVVYDGEHSQMIEINTLGFDQADADRYAGVYQIVAGLTPSATYRLSLHGMLRVLGQDQDLAGYNYRVEWGYDPAGGIDWEAVDNWIEIPWNTIHGRLDPGAMASYTTAFEAPSSKITLYIRVWKKWATLDRELDVNLDGITLKGFK